MSLKRFPIAVAFGMMALVVPGVSFAGEVPAGLDKAPTTQEASVDEQVRALHAMCDEAEGAMAQRQAEASLFQRVGGREGLHQVVAETVRRHGINPRIQHLLEGVDRQLLIERVTDFLVVGTGGEGEYHGRDMVAAHAHLHLDNADFLAAGGDLSAAMDVAGWGENEKQELLCAFVKLRPQVVTE